MAQTTADLAAQTPQNQAGVGHLQRLIRTGGISGSQHRPLVRRGADINAMHKNQGAALDLIHDKRPDRDSCEKIRVAKIAGEMKTGSFGLALGLKAYRNVRTNAPRSPAPRLTPQIFRP